LFEDKDISLHWTMPGLLKDKKREEKRTFSSNSKIKNIELKHIRWRSYCSG
jgi:hypothetical protein